MGISDTLCQMRRIGRCGRCEACIAHRRWLWTDRAKEETKCSPRTWFCTFTFSSPPATQREVTRSLQRYLKRLRKNTGQPIRYFATTEKGSKTGRLHLHALIHCAPELSYRQLCGPWTAGFSHARLVKSSTSTGAAISYVTKYVTKGHGRVLASRRYGYVNPKPESKSITVMSETANTLLSGKHTSLRLPNGHKAKSLLHTTNPPKGEAITGRTVGPVPVVKLPS